NPEPRAGQTRPGPAPPPGGRSPAMAFGVEDRPIVAAGQETLRRMADVDHYNAWIYQLIAPYLGRRVVEVGCGLGNMTASFLQAEFLLAFDLLDESAAWVSAKFPNRPNLRVQQGDVCDAAFVQQAATHGFDTAISINMLEHVERDDVALAHMHQLLGPQGT